MNVIIFVCLWSFIGFVVFMGNQKHLKTVKKNWQKALIILSSGLITIIVFCGFIIYELIKGK